MTEPVKRYASKKPKKPLSERTDDDIRKSIDRALKKPGVREMMSRIYWQGSRGNR